MSDLVFDNVSVRLGKRDVLRGLALEIGSGQFVGLIGPNGAGKSTLLRAVMGLVDHSGMITLSGHELKLLDARKRATQLTFLPQEREVAWPVSVEALVALGRMPHRRGIAGFTEQDEAAVEQALRTMDLDALRGRSALELSGGEKARALIARALAQDTNCLLADEPTAGLDPAHQISLMETFSALARGGRLVVASMHDLAVAALWCDQLLILDHGRVHAFGPPDEVLNAETLSSVYGVRAQLVETDRGKTFIPMGLPQP